MRGVLSCNEPLAPHTAWHIGGIADQYYRPADLEDLTEFLANLPPEEKLTWLGLGSNVLISDAGIRGVVVHLLLPNAAITETAAPYQYQLEQTVIRAEAGATCAKLAKFCAKKGLTESEFFAGIPGTVGGALAMNAGAWGGETWRHVVAVEVINRRGERFFRTPDHYQIAYRSVGLKQHTSERTGLEEWFIAGYFQFAAGEQEQGAQRIKNLLRQRAATQPTGVFSCGSVFKNPQGHYAAQLIEASNLKGYQIGDAQISLKHANFIINLGNAKAQDVLQLIQHIQAVVLKEHHIALQPEVRLLGF